MLHPNSALAFYIDYTGHALLGNVKRKRGHSMLLHDLLLHSKIIWNSCTEIAQRCFTIFYMHLGLRLCCGVHQLCIFHFSASHDFHQSFSFPCEQLLHVCRHVAVGDVRNIATDNLVVALALCSHLVLLGMFGLNS